MKFLLLIMFVAIASATDQGPRLTQDEWAQNLAQAFRMDPADSLECLRKTGATSEDMQYKDDVTRYRITEAIDTKSLRRASCAEACCAQKVGLMRGGEVQVEKLLKFLRETGMPDDIETRLRNTLYVCKEEVTDTSDECMASFKFGKCVYDRTQSVVGHR